MIVSITLHLPLPNVTKRVRNSPVFVYFSEVDRQHFSHSSEVDRQHFSHSSEVSEVSPWPSVSPASVEGFSGSEAVSQASL